MLRAARADAGLSRRDRTRLKLELRGSDSVAAGAD